MNDLEVIKMPMSGRKLLKSSDLEARIKSLGLLIFAHTPGTKLKPEELAKRATDLDAATKELPQLLADVASAKRPATKGEIAMHLSALMKSVPYDGGKGDSVFFGRQLIEDVGEHQPSFAALELACRNIRWESDFIPSIAKILKAIAAMEALLDSMQPKAELLAMERERVACEIREEERMARIRAERAAGNQMLPA